MKLADAYHALCMAFCDYAPFPEDAAYFVRNSLAYRGRVYYGGEWVDMDDMPELLRGSYKSAGDIRLTWWGGPPMKQKWITGSLLQFVFDKLHNELLVNRDPNGVVYHFIRHRMMERVNRHELEHRI